MATFGDQKGVGGYTYCRVVMKPSPLAPFVMPQAYLLFEFFVIALNPPAQLGEVDQLLKRNRRRQGREPVFGRCALACRPFEPSWAETLLSRHIICPSNAPSQPHPLINDFIRAVA